MGNPNMTQSKKGNIFQINDTLSLNKVILYTTVIYLFGVLVRLIMLYQAGQIGPLWSGENPISVWAPDAGRYGYYAKQILTGIELPFRDDYLLGYLVAYFAKNLHISIDWAMLLFPVIVAPLIVVPIIMLGSAIKAPILGLLSAAIAVSGTFFYVRSTIGYVDTDGINMFLMLMSMAFIILAFAKKSLIYGFLGALTIALFGWWYHSAAILNISVVGSAFLYILLYDKKEKTSLSIFLLLLPSLAPVGFLEKIFLLSISFILLYSIQKNDSVKWKHYWFIILVGFIGAFLFLHPEHYINRAQSYLSQADSKTFISDGIKYYYINDLKNIAEVVPVNLWNAYAPLYVTKIYIWLATFGFVLMLFGKRAMIATLPLLILGYLSSWAGSRFTMFATPMMAFGFVYLTYVVRNILAMFFEKSRYIVRLPYYATALVLVLMIYNIFSWNSGKWKRLQFYSDDVKLLKSFSKNLSNNDTIVGEWDYGWPLWYYTGRNITLSDNGYHGGPDTHIIAQMLLSNDQYFVANAARYLSRYKAPKNNYAATFTLPLILKDQTIDQLLYKLHNQNKIKLLNEKGNVYLILYQNMIKTYGVTERFAYYNMKKGYLEKDRIPEYNITPIVKPFSHDYGLLEGFGYIFDSSDGKLMDADGNKSKINMLMISRDNKRKESYTYHKNSNMNLLDAKGMLFWLDQKAYNGFYIQAFLLDVYDHNLFEKVGETPRMKIFRVKRPKE